ncbi:MAG: hypothetical protein NAG76_17985 [Candidatus Pristimantibacillus lignocellulolyticus]|uniref:Uncharacterized protein n=1 Tax=Candidatus Pristimantibacillus lignocellulolyticus TaxID=2994561 RepID=A0A9J6ZC79_9BACL|nr:MAG: hypothetical protein NAG76_17985 [Candidatus Pristimantibacillus lignocellulolyticus]
MSDEHNYVHNEHELTDNNGQRQNKVHGGEHRNGRLSQMKNNNHDGEDVPNEYISDKGFQGSKE